MNTTCHAEPKQAKARKPRPKPERRIRVLEQPTADTDFWGAVEIAVGKTIDRYLVRLLESDFGNGAIGFEVEKLDADLNAVEQYHVHLSDNPADTSCTCKGGTYCGNCKHAEGLAALRKAGKLLPIVKDEPPPPDDAA